MTVVWKKTALGSLGRIVTGKTPSSERPEDFGDVYPFITPSDISGTAKRTVTERFLSEQGAAGLKGSLLPDRAVCVVCIGATIGKVTMTDRPSCSNQQINSIIPHSGQHDPDFVYYLCRLLPATLVSFAGGAATPIINKSTFSSIEVPVPEYKAQGKIAAVLSAYDDLIANNQRRIALLESMAEEIYREWFVRMRFPGKTANAPESIEPTGWHRTALGELTCLLKRGVSPNYDEKATAIVVNQKCIRNGRLDLADARLHDTPTPDEKLLRYGDVLINSTGVGTLGRAAVFDLDRENITCDSHVTIARPRDVQGEGEFLAFTVQLLQSYFEAMASGSTGQAELGRDFIAKTKVLVPPHELMQAFGERVRPMRKQRRLLMDANEQLVGMRDALLPRLISGKLRVDQLDIQFPPSMRAETAEAAP